MQTTPVTPVFRKSSKPKAKAEHVDKIVSMHRQNFTNKQIADKLGINGQSVNGVIASAKRQGVLPPSGPAVKGAVAVAMNQGLVAVMQGKLDDLKQAWKKEDPDSELTFRLPEGQKIYIASFPQKGLVLRIGEQSQVTFLSQSGAIRFGTALVNAAMALSRVQPAPTVQGVQ